MNYRITPLLGLLLLGGCDQQPPAPTTQATTTNTAGAVDELSIIEVNGFDFMFNEREPGGVIMFSSQTFNQCNLSFIKSRFTAGFHARVEGFDQADVDLTCLNHNGHFSMSPVKPTFIDMTVSELNAQQAMVDLSFSLYSQRNAQTVTREHVRLIIDGDALQRLRDF